MRVIGNSIKSAHILSVFDCVNHSNKCPVEKLKAADVLYFEKRYVEAYHAYQDIYSTQSKKTRICCWKWPTAITSFKAGCQPTHIFRILQRYALSCSATVFWLRQCSAPVGHIKEAFAIYTRINRFEGDANTREYESTFRAYFDSTAYFQTYDLDAGTACVELDATESLDTLAAPMVYLWDFKDGTVKDGLRVLHCYKSGGEHKVVLSIRDKATGFVRKADTTLTVYVGEAPVKFNLRTCICTNIFLKNFEVLNQHFTDPRLLNTSGTLAMAPWIPVENWNTPILNSVILKCSLVLLQKQHNGRKRKNYPLQVARSETKFWRRYRQWQIKTFPAFLSFLMFAATVCLQAQEVPSGQENIPYRVTFGQNSEHSWGDDDFSQTVFYHS